MAEDTNLSIRNVRGGTSAIVILITTVANPQIDVARINTTFAITLSEIWAGITIILSEIWFLFRVYPG
jgi:hypothetical protein